jgi:Zn-finger nucleic acid-binding protein
MAYRQAPLREIGTACPRCGPSALLVARKLGKLRPRECPSCWGLWLDTADYRELGSAAGEALAGLTIRPPGGDVTPRLRCPFCDRLMKRRLFRKRAGVTIDACQKHGVWFDVDELRQAFLVVTAPVKKWTPISKPPPKGKPVKIDTGGPSGEATLRQAVRLLWKALFGELVAEPRPLRPRKKR